MKQTYDNYYRNYFSTDKGKEALNAARMKYYEKLRRRYPGVGVNRAMRMAKRERKAGDV